MKEIRIDQLQINPVTLFSEEWALVTAGTQEMGFNTMTVCWGHIGAIWGQGKGLPTAVVYIRPQRYTREFVDREDIFTISVFPAGFKKQLAYLGTHSGRDTDKLGHTGLTPVFGKGCAYFAQAKLVLVCRKLYCAPLAQTGFLDWTVMEANYPEKDFHRVYIGQIIKVLVSE